MYSLDHSVVRGSSIMRWTRLFSGCTAASEVLRTPSPSPANSGNAVNSRFPVPRSALVVPVVRLWYSCSWISIYEDSNALTGAINWVPGVISSFPCLFETILKSIRDYLLIISWRILISLIGSGCMREIVKGSIFFSSLFSLFFFFFYFRLRDLTCKSYGSLSSSFLPF